MKESLSEKERRGLSPHTSTNGSSLHFDDGHIYLVIGTGRDDK